MTIIYFEQHTNPPNSVNVFPLSVFPPHANALTGRVKTLIGLGSVALVRSDLAAVDELAVGIGGPNA